MNALMSILPLLEEVSSAPDFTAISTSMTGIINVEAVGAIFAAIIAGAGGVWLFRVGAVKIARALVNVVQTGKFRIG